MIPDAFKTPRSLRAVNVAAVGLALAAMTTAAFMACWADPRANWSVVVGLPTLVMGTFWAWLLRSPEKIGRTSLGWVMSLPLAAANAGLACGLMFLNETRQPLAFFGGVVLGVTFGAIIWLPAWILVLLVFGLPLARAKKLAARGLAGEDHGERFIGLACAALSFVALLLSRFASGAVSPLFFAFALFSCALGVTAASVAHKRETERRRFVARAAAGQIAGLRVEPRPIGKVVVRDELHVETYRIAPRPDEELIELDDDGRALRSLR